MAVEIISPKEIRLNSVRYPLIGKICPMLTSVFPEKQVVGDFTLVSDPYVDSWVISDQRGGILVEEMDEAKHPDRAYWSTCNLGFKGHIILPPLATPITMPGVVTTAATLANTDFEATGSWTNGTRDGTQKHSGTYAFYVNGADGYQEANTWSDTWQSKTFTFSAWVYAVAASSGRIGISDKDGSTTYHAYHAGNSAWAFQTLTVTLAADATRLRCVIDEQTGSNNAWFDDATIGSPVGTTAVKWVNFNTNWYLAFGQILCKLDKTAGASYTVVATMPATITGMIEDGTNLYIYLGDTDHYWYMDTDEKVYRAFDTTHSLSATYGIYWDSKVFKMDSAGVLALLTDPATETPVATAKGSLPIDDNEVKTLFPYYNVDGDDIVYAGTSSGLWAHDYANAKWLQTQLKTPDHTNSGKGVCAWRDGAFISAGLDVMKYVPNVPAIIQSVGLDRDDGMPVEYVGEITCMTPGYNELYAAVDASQVSGTGYSTIMAYDGKGWQCKWADSTADQTITALGVSSVYAYRLWFNVANTVYYIPLHHNLRNPLKITTDTHGTAGVHITPWFDANWQTGNKLALRFKVNVLEDVSSDESVVVRYRTDHATSAIASTNFTTLGTIITSGLTTYNFASSVGEAFKSIQFRFDLARKVADTDETPDILYAVLEYVKVIPKRWGWRFTVDCSQDWHGKNSKQLIDALITAAELETLVTLVYDTTTKYVQIKSVTGERETGRTRKGQYEVFVTELF